MGNMRSILNMLKKIGVEGIISSKYDEIANAEKLILPGVGAFDSGIAKLHDYGLIEMLNKKVVEEKTPILGICLGMQLFTKRSDEGTLPGLGWVDAETVKFKFDDNQAGLKIPHMGWDKVTQCKKNRADRNEIHHRDRRRVLITREGDRDIIHWRDNESLRFQGIRSETGSLFERRSRNHEPVPARRSIRHRRRSGDGSGPGTL